MDYYEDEENYKRYVCFYGNSINSAFHLSEEIETIRQDWFKYNSKTKILLDTLGKLHKALSEIGDDYGVESKQFLGVKKVYDEIETEWAEVRTPNVSMVLDLKDKTLWKFGKNYE